MSPSVDRIALWIFLAFSTVYVATTRGHFVGTDEVTVYQTTRSIWESGNLATNPTLPNSLPARGGGAVGVYGVGQSVAALPLYALGKAVERGLSRIGRDDWIETFAGGVLEYGGPDYRWGGDVEIFFVNLFNAFVTACLCAVFFLFASALGVGCGNALSATVLLGLASYAAPFSSGFLQHSLEALLLLGAFYFLFRDSRSPSGRLRLWAGICLAAIPVIRPQAVVAFPVLGLYAAGVIRRRRRPAEALPILLPLAAGLLVYFVVNYLKFGTLALAGGYRNQAPFFGWPAPAAIYGFLFSPGASIFFFTPLLLLLPWAMPAFFREHRAEAFAAVFLFVLYLGLHASFRVWHGLWSAPGPRYLMPTVPILLLAVAVWIDRAGRRAWVAILPLAVAGCFVQLVDVATNFAYIYNREGYLHFQPEFGFLFIPWVSPIAAEARALFSGGPLVDMWLVNVERRFGVGRLLEIGVPLAAFLALCVWRLLRATREAPAAGGGGRIRRAAAVLAVVVTVATAIGLAGASRRWPSKERTAREDALMKAGLDLFYAQRRPADAVENFRRVLELNPDHYGARFQLAFALESSGRRDEARKEWKRVREMAERYRDAGTAENARRHLEDLK